MLKKLFFFCTLALQPQIHCMEMEQYSPFSYMPLEITDYIVNQSNLTTINSFSQTNKFHHERYNLDKTLSKNNVICSSLTSKQRLYGLIESAQREKPLIFQSIMNSETQKDKKSRAKTLHFFNYKQINHFASNCNEDPCFPIIDCIKCSIKAYQGKKYCPTTSLLKNAISCLDAVYSKNYNALLILIKNNADINQKDELNKTPLITAISKELYKIAKLLLSNRCSINDQDKLGQAAIHYAALANNIRATKLLIKHKCYINLQTASHNNTALHIALKNNHLKLATLLIENGADTTIKNDRGKTALDLTSKKNQKLLTEQSTNNKRKRTDDENTTEKPLHKKSKNHAK